MGAGNYSKLLTVLSGQIITASERNNEHDNHITNHNFPGLDDYSTDNTEMQTTTDPYPASVEARPTTGAGELAILRYQLLEMHKRMAPGQSETKWYADFPYIWGRKGTDIVSANSLTIPSDGNFFDVTGTVTVTLIGTKGVGSLIMLQFDSTVKLTHHSTDLVLPGGKDFYTKTGDILTFVEYASGDWFCVAINRTRADGVLGYRRPRLVYVSATTVDVEENTGTDNETTIMFPDGDVRSVTEDTSATNVNRRFIITATMSPTGTKDSGLHTALTEVVDTWYALYAVKVTDNNTDFVLSGDTTLPLQTNFAALNSRYGTNSWVYLGMIRNGDSASATGDIVSFVQVGNKTLFRNAVTGAGGAIGPGILFGNVTNTASLQYTYNAGTTDLTIPGTLEILVWEVLFSDSDTAAATFFVFDNSSAYRVYAVGYAASAVLAVQVELAAADGINVDISGAGTPDYSILVAGFVDRALVGEGARV